MTSEPQRDDWHTRPKKKNSCRSSATPLADLDASKVRRRAVRVRHLTEEQLARGIFVEDKAEGIVWLGREQLVRALATGELLESGFSKATSDFKDAPWVELALASKRYPMVPVVNAEKKSPPTHEALSRAQTRAQDLIRDFCLRLAGYHSGRASGGGGGNAAMSQ